MRNDGEKLNLEPKDGILSYFFSLFATLLLSIPVGLIPAGNTQTLLNYFVTQLGFLIVPFIYLARRKISPLDAIPIKSKVKVIPLLLVIPISIGAFLQNTILSVLFNNLLEIIGITPSVNIPSTEGVGNAILAIVAVCLLPALAEEFLFRGVMLTSYRKKGLMPAMLLISLTFALSHFNPAQLVHQAILGFLLAYVTIVSGSIWYGVLIHLLNNLIALFLGDVIPAFNDLYNLNTTNILILLAMCVVGVIILSLSLVAFYKTSVKEDLKVENPFHILSKKKAPSWWNGEKMKDPMTIGTLVFMVVMGILSTFAQLIEF